MLGAHPVHGRAEGLCQAPEAAEVLLEATELKGRGLVEAAALLADSHLLLPQVGASDQEQVTQQELDRLGQGELGECGDGGVDGQMEGWGGQGGPCGQASLRGTPAGLHGRGIALPV